MDEDAKSRLQGLIQTKNDITRLMAEKEEAKRRDEQEKEGRKQAAAQQWLVSRAQIGEAVRSINAEIQQSGMRLIENAERKDVSPAIAQHTVHLHEDGQGRECRAVFNINAYGMAQPVFLIPHSGKAPGSFSIYDVGEEHFRGLLIDFLEQLLSYRKSKIK